MNPDKLMETIRAVKIPCAYRIYPDDLLTIVQANDGKATKAALDVFRYGFLKGQRAARAEDKRKAKERYHREMEKHAQGYGLLMALIDKNKSNGLFVGCVSSFALEMVGCVDKEAI